MSAIATREALARTLGVLQRPSTGRGDAVGFVGPDVPIEVLLASGKLFGHLPWEPTGSTAWADRWLESSFPFWARSMLEQWHAGAFDEFGTVVFSRSDDASQRLYYYVSELRRRGLIGGPAPTIFDIAHVQRDTSVRHTAAAIVELCRVLDVPPATLSDAVESANRLRAALTDLDRSRAANGPFYERLGRLALWSDPTQWIHDVDDHEQEHGGLRVLLAGSVPPDDRLHRAVEAAGASVIAEAHVHALVRLGPAVALDAGPPERQLAVQLRQASVGPRAMIDRARWLVERATSARAAAVVLWLTREDEALAWHVPAQRRALAAAELPVLILPAARWQADDDTPERIAGFCTEAMHATA
jgi:2-hydroxyglutaryl-CoA dehydratase, D-component